MEPATKLYEKSLFETVCVTKVNPLDLNTQISINRIFKDSKKTQSTQSHSVHCK